MSILVTGGTGYIGSHTVVELLSAGEDVVIVDNLANSSEKVLDRIEQIIGKKPKFYKADCCDKEAMEKLFSENELDAVIHFAGLKAVGESCRMPIEYYKNNIDSTLVLLEVMRAHGVKNIIFSSSATVYGAPDCVPIKETAVVGRCTNPYGWTKYMNEVILTDATITKGIVFFMSSGIPRVTSYRSILIITKQLTGIRCGAQHIPMRI